MANKGLKSYTKQISQTIGDVAKVSVNVNQADANMHILIPLFATLGPNPIELNLLWNYQDRDRIGHFGKGCNINTYKDFSDNETYISVREADGAYTSYWDEKGYNEFRADENSITILKHVTLISGDSDEYTYEFKDQQGNRICYDNGNTYYPTSIKYANGEKIIFDGINMDNGYGAKVTFTESNRVRTRATYTQDGTTLYYVDFEYDTNQRLTSVKHYKESKLVKHLSISYESNEITVKDEISKDYAKYTFNSNCVTKIIEVLNNNDSNSVQTSIAYEDRRTTLTDHDGRKVYIYFDSNQFPLYEIDEDGNVVETEFDAITKKLVKGSSIIPTKKKMENICSIDISNFTTTGSISTSLENVSDGALSGILDKVYRVRGTGTLKYCLSTEGLGSDTITAVLWGRQITPHSDTSKVKVTLTVDEQKSDEFKKKEIDSYFDVMTLGLTALKSYSTITLTITLTGNSEIEIGGIQLLKKDFGAFYTYDENGNVTGLENGKGSVSSVYNSKGLQISSVGKDSSLYSYEYDDKGNMTLAKTAFGGKFENTYDSYNNVTKNVVSNAGGTKKLETTKTYENGRFVSSETDGLGNKTNYTYDSFGKIKKITDALNVTTEYSYDAFDNLTKILFNNSVSASYTYDSQNKLKTVTLSNGTIYSFGYDSSNNLNSVSMNGELIVSFTYDIKTGLITNQKYGTSGDTFDFIYNTKHDIKQIKINGSIKYQYEYDDFDQLIEVKNGSGTVLKSYTYNNDGQLTKAIENSSCIEYSYDNLGGIVQRKRTLNSKTIYESYDSISKSKGFSPDNLIGYLQGNEDFLGTMFQETVELKNPMYVLSALDYKTNQKSNPVYTRKNKVSCVQCGLSNPISYNPPMKNTTEDCGSIGFWFYPTEGPKSNTKKYLMSIRNKSLPCSVAVYINDIGQVILEVTDSQNETEMKTLDSKIVLNTWNFFCLNFMYRIDELGLKDSWTFELYHNSKCLKGKINRTIQIGSITPYHIGYRFDGTNGYEALDYPITAFMVGRRFYLTSKQIQDFYIVTKDYILGNSYIEEDSVNFSSTTVHNISSEKLNQFEIYPLQNSVHSLKGRIPLAYDVRRISSTDKDRTFSYNKSSKRYAFMAEGNRLEYDLSMSKAGTILMRAYIKEDTDVQYLFECKDSKGNTIGLYRDKDKYLGIAVNDFMEQTNLKLNTQIWSTIGITFKEENLDKIILVYLNGTTYKMNVNIAVTFDYLTLSLGRKTDPMYIESEMGVYDTCYAMLGQIEMLATRAAYSDVVTLKELEEELKSTSIVSEYDELGLLNRRVIKRQAEDEVMSINYEYKTRRENSIPENYEEVDCFIRDVEQLIRIAPYETVTLEANQVYIGVAQDIQELNPDVLLTKVSWDISEEAYDDFGSEGQTEYDHMDQAFLVLENKTWTNTSQYSVYIVDLGFKYETQENSPYISTLIRKETYQTNGGNTMVRTYKSSALGNIESIEDTTFGSHTYTYNARGFLTKEDSIEYAYDHNGNIIKAGTTTFTYDMTIKDRLKTVNGKEITYGTNRLNPISYNGNTYEWEGRRLIKLNSNEYSYNDQGLRISKKANGIITNYYYDKDKLITEVTPSYRLDFLYDENDMLYGFIYNNDSKYYYVRDFMQNILGIIDSNGKLVVKYGYTAYGTITSILGSLAGTIGVYNPIRYKGYYYDTETNLYLLTTRYYNPEWCRFISPDSIEYLDPSNINGLNLYAYCNNDPINYVDPSGHTPKWLQGLAIGLAVVGTILVVGAITALTMGVGTTIMATTMAGAVIHGAAVGTLIGAGIGVVAGGIIGGATTNWSTEGILVGMGIGFGGGAIIGAIAGGSVGAFQYTSAVSQWGSAGGRTAQQNMIHHFNKHVIGDGHSYLGKNVIQYTKNASNFFKNNSSLMKLTSSGNYVIRASFAGHSAGGFFDLAGIIFSFF